MGCLQSFGKPSLRKSVRRGRHTMLLLEERGQRQSRPTSPSFTTSRVQRIAC